MNRDSKFKVNPVLDLPTSTSKALEKLTSKRDEEDEIKSKISKAAISHFHQSSRVALSGESYRKGAEFGVPLGESKAWRDIIRLITRKDEPQSSDQILIVSEAKLLGYI